MLKALLRKQFQELLAAFVTSRKDGKKKTGAALIGYIALYVLLFVSLASLFFSVADTLAPQLLGGGQEWIYFALMSIMSLAIGLFGSVFSTYNTLYHAKDNWLLLSLPIPPRNILFARVLTVYATSVVFNAVAWLPACIVYWINVPATALTIILQIFLWLVLSLLTTVLSCLLGWVVALISSKLKNKNIATVILSLALIALYYYVIGRMNSFLQSILLAADAIGATIQTWIYPLYQLSLGACGQVVPALIAAAIFAALFALCYWILVRTFTRIVTAQRTAKKKVYREQTAKVTSVPRALLRKELRMFLSSPTYMLNCGLGLIFAPVLTILAIIYSGQITELAGVFLQEAPEVLEAAALIIACLVCLMSSTSAVSAPSISLEGKRVWQLQTLPVGGWQVLAAKETLHILLNLFPALFMSVTLGIIFQLSLVSLLLENLLVLVFIFFLAAFGLSMNILRPVMNWNSEAIPVKQSFSVTVSLFGGWIIAILMGALYFLLHISNTTLYLIGCIAILAAITAFLNSWLKNRGAEKFMHI